MCEKIKNNSIKMFINLNLESVSPFKRSIVSHYSRN